MSVRPEKRAMGAHLRELLANSDYVFLADFSGLSVARMTELRRRLRPVEARLQVTPNAMLRIAAAEIGWDGWDNLRGPTAIIVGKGEATEVARVVTEFIGEFEKPALKGGRLGSWRVDAAGLVSLSKLPPRPVMRARLLGQISAPMRGLVTVLQQTVARLLHVLRAAEEKKKKAQSPSNGAGT